MAKEVEGELVPAEPRNLELRSRDLIEQRPEPVPNDDIVWENKAQVVLPADKYAMWFKGVNKYLKRLGAENSVDYQAVVATAGHRDGKMLYRITWKALTKKGKKFLTMMAMTFRHIPNDPKQLTQQPKQLEKKDDTV